MVLEVAAVWGAGRGRWMEGSFLPPPGRWQWRRMVGGGAPSPPTPPPVILDGQFASSAISISHKFP